jgi:hypothetical protein
MVTRVKTASNTHPSVLPIRSILQAWVSQDLAGHEHRRLSHGANRSLMPLSGALSC